MLTAEQNLYTAQNDLAMAEGSVSTGSGLGLPRSGRRMADPRGKRIRARRNGRGDEKPHQLGRAVAASGYAAAAGAGAADPGKMSAPTRGRRNGEVAVKIFSDCHHRAGAGRTWLLRGGDCRFAPDTGSEVLSEAIRRGHCGANPGTEPSRRRLCRIVQAQVTHQPIPAGSGHPAEDAERQPIMWRSPATPRR